MAKKQKVTLTPEQKAKKAQAKRDAFIKVVVPRMTKAIKAIRLVGNCSSGNYLYTTEQAVYIYEALVNAVQAVEKAYSGKAEKEAEFAFKV